MMNVVFISIIAVIAAGGCEENVLLYPDSIVGNVGSSSYPLTNLLDGNFASIWIGNSNGEYVYYDYSSKVIVKEVFVQRYHNYANRFDVYDGSTTSRTYFESSTEYHDTATFPMHNVQTDQLRFYITWHDNTHYYFSRIEPYGCYNTSSPTTVPTSAPTKLPTVLPTVSPTLPPVTTYPTKTPSVFPTTSPTESPSADNPSTYPSISPTRSPTELPSQTEPPSVSPSWSPTQPPSQTEPPSPIPSRSPSFSPTVVYIDRGGYHITVGQVEFLIIVVVALCGVILFLFRRYKIVSQVVDNFQSAPESEMQIVQTHDIEEAIKKIISKNGMNRKAEMDRTSNYEGENSNAVYYNRTNQEVDEEKNERIQSQLMCDQTVDFRFGLDKVNSDI